MKTFFYFLVMVGCIALTSSNSYGQGSTNSDDNRFSPGTHKVSGMDLGSGRLHLSGTDLGSGRLKLSGTGLGSGRIQAGPLTLFHSGSNKLPARFKEQAILHGDAFHLYDEGMWIRLIKQP